MKAVNNFSRGITAAQEDCNIFLIILLQKILVYASLLKYLFFAFIGRSLEYSQSFVFLSTVFLGFFVAFAPDTLLIR